MGLSRVEYSLDNGATFAAASGTASWSATVDSTTVPDGGLPIMARSTDSAGNVAYDFVTVIVENADPTVEIINPQADDLAFSGYLPIIGLANKLAGAGDYVEVSLDGAAYTQTGVDFNGMVWKYLIDTTALTEALHTISVRGYRDSDDVYTAVVERTFFVDQTVPNVSIDTPASGSYIKGIVDFTGTSQDDTGVDRVDLSFDGGSTWQTVTGTTSWSHSLASTALADGAITVIARALDLSEPPLSGTISIPVVIDNNNPTISLDAPADGAVASDVIHFSGSSSDTVGVETVELQFGAGNDFLAVNGTTSWNLDFDPWDPPVPMTPLANGSYAVTVHAIDFADNVAQTSITVKVDANMPSVTNVLGVVDGGHYKGAVAISGDVGDADFGDTVDAVEISMDGGLGWAAVSGFTAGSSSFNHSLDTTGHSDGQYILVIRATDNWGGSSQLAYDVTIDNTLPVLAVIQPAESADVSGNVLVTGSITESNLDTLDITITDGVTTVTDSLSPSAGQWSYLWDSSAFAVGSVTITVDALDLAGNSGQAVRVVQKTNTTASISITSPSTGTYQKATVAVTGTSSTPLGAVTAVDVSLDGGSTYLPATDTSGGTWATWEYILDTTTLSGDGSYDVMARVTTDSTPVNTSAIVIIVDNTLPALAVTSPTAAFVGANALYGQVTIEGTATDANPDTAVVEISYDSGSSWTPVATSGYETFSHLWDTQTAVPGSAQDGIQLRASATDLAGNSATSAVITVDVHPYISALSVSTASRGESITVSGSNFNASSLVFKAGAGTVDGTITAQTATSVSVTVPATATSGNVYALTNGLASNAKNLDIWGITTHAATTWLSASSDGGSIYSTYIASGAAGARYQVFRKDGGATVQVSPEIDEKPTIVSSAVAGLGTEIFVAYTNTKNETNHPIGVSVHRSTDGGASFGTRTMPTTAAVNFLSMAVWDPDSLVADNTQVWLAGYDTATASLVVFSSTDSGATWTSATVDETSADVGRYASLDLYSDDPVTPAAYYPVVAYRDTANQILKLAYWDGSAWTLRIVDETGNVGDYADLDVDADGGAHISYFDGNSGDLKYAHASAVDGGFSTQVAVSAGIAGFYTALAADAAGTPHIVFYDFSSNSMVYTYWDGAAWPTYRIPEKDAFSWPGTITGNFVHVVIDADDGKPWFFYPAGANYKLANFIQ